MKFDEAVISGFSETKFDVATGRSAYDLAGDVLAGLVEATGIDRNEIDGMVACSSTSEASNNFWSPFLADYLGLELDWCQGMDLGGASFTAAVSRAAMAVQAGACNTVLVLAADAPTTENRSDIRAYRTEWQDPVGLMGPPGAFGLLSSRYNAQYGLKHEALAKLAVTQRAHALLNPNACEKLRKPLTEAEYLASRMISDPIRLLDCVMSCDGANGVLVMRRDRAKRSKMPTVRMTGYGERTHYGMTDPLTDVTTTGHLVAGQRALASSGRRHADISMFQPYDDFLIAIVLQLEQIGFCKPGQGCDYVLSTDMSFRGKLPLNTGGGQISAGQPGLAGGGLNFVEAVRQLSGLGGERQVPAAAIAPGKAAMVTGIGSIPYIRNWSTSNVMILEGAQ